jgi:hypothetical protein
MSREIMITLLLTGRREYVHLKLIIYGKNIKTLAHNRHEIVKKFDMRV